MKQNRATLDPMRCPRCGGVLRFIGGLRRCGCGHAAGEQNPVSDQPRNSVGRVEALLTEERS